MTEIKLNAGSNMLAEAGFTAEEIAVWDERFKESGLPVTYEEWCTAVIALNGQEATDEHAELVGRAFMDALNGVGTATKRPLKVATSVKIGSYQYKKKQKPVTKKRKKP